MNKNFCLVKRGLAVVLSVGMIFGGMDMSALAAEIANETTIEEKMEESAAIAGLIDEKEIPDEAEVKENAEEADDGSAQYAEEIEHYEAAGDIASGRYEDITWAITAAGKLTVNGTGNFREYSWENAPWYDYGDVILSAVVNVSGMTDAAGMFDGCCNLERVDLSKFNTSNVADMGYMFRYCNSLTSLDLSKFDTRNVIGMGWMFEDCSSLTSLDLSKFDTGNVIDMQSMFEDCSSLTSLDLSKFDTSNVIDMGWMFEDCSSLTNLDLRKINTENVTDMENMFSGCSSLTNIDLSKFDTSKVDCMSGMFAGCSNLSSIDLSKFDTSNVCHMSYMFSDCSGLTNIDLSKFDTREVTEMNGLFHGCGSLTSIDLSKFDTRNVTNMDGLFYGCSSLTNIDLSKFDTRNVTDMRSMFSGCSSLTSIDLSKFDTRNVTFMEAMFGGCSSLTSLDLSKFDTRNVTHMDRMFASCSSLTSLDLSGFNLNNIYDDVYFDSVSYMLSGCNSLTTIYTPHHLSKTVYLPASPNIYIDGEWTWYTSDGSIVTELPQNLSYSIALGKNYIPVEKPQKENIIQKELIDTETLTIQFLDKLTGAPIKDGKVRIEKEYSLTDEHYYLTDANGCVYTPYEKDSKDILLFARFEGYESLGGWYALKESRWESGVYVFKVQPKRDRYVPPLPKVNASVNTSGPDVESNNERYSVLDMKQEYNLDFGNRLQMKATIDEKTDSLKVVFSTGEDLEYDKVKHRVKRKDMTSLEEMLCSLIDKIGTQGKFADGSVKLLVSGYVEYDKFGVPIEGGAIVALKGKAEVGYRPACTAGVAYGKFVFEATASGDVKIKEVDGNLSVNAVFW